jgi:hypothetical protein
MPEGWVYLPTDWRKRLGAVLDFWQGMPEAR